MDQSFFDKLSELQQQASPLEVDAERRARDLAAVNRYTEAFIGRLPDDPTFRLTEDKGIGLYDHPIREEAREIAVEKLRRVGLTPETADLFPAELSGGMQKRVGLARAIAAEPEIIFFDEPTTGLDPIMSGVINELIREIVVEMGATAMTITHDMSSVRAIADKVAMLHEGVVQWTGPVAAMDESGDPYLDQFINARAEGPIEAVR